MTEKKLILAVASTEDGQYFVDIPAGSNIAETAFAMSVVIRCFVKDGVINDPKVVTDLINKYLTESQYNEV